MRNRTDWRKNLDWKYPYKDCGMYGCLNDHCYIKDRDEIFNKNGNGWWYGDGWWNGHNDTVAERQRRYRKRIS